MIGATVKELWEAGSPVTQPTGFIPIYVHDSVPFRQYV